MEEIKRIYDSVSEDTSLSLDERLYETYRRLGTEVSFDEVKKDILYAVGIDEYSYYTKDVLSDLQRHVEEKVFHLYEQNDQAHGIIHILEVIRRSFALNETLKLGLDKNMIYAIAACHDLGKYIDSDNHHLIAARMFMEDECMKKFFSDDERITIMEAIEDHRSSKEDTPRSDYGKLISSADRNTKIEIVFIRSFFVAKVRQPESNMEDYLDYTYKRLSKRYGEENPENMFYEDETYRVFLRDMRELLKDEVKFKDMYCQVNNITSREHLVKEEEGIKRKLKV